MTLVRTLLIAFSTTCSLAVVILLGRLALFATLDLVALGVVGLCVLGMAASLAGGLRFCTSSSEPMRERILRIVGDLI